MATKARVSVDPQVAFDQYIAFSGAMSAANVFTQITIPTNIDPNNEFVIVVKEVQVSLDSQYVITAFQTIMDFSLTRASKSAVVTLLDPDVIAKWKLSTFGGGAFTAGLSAAVENPVNMVYSGRQIIAGPNVYMGVSTTNLAGALTFSGRIYYETQTMKKADILEILYG